LKKYLEGNVLRNDKKVLELREGNTVFLKIRKIVTYGFESEDK